MTDLNNLLSKSLNAYDKNRDRSKQVEVGPSSIGGCRRQVYYQLQEAPKTNPNTESLASILGTFIHTGIAEAIKREDPFGENFLIEQAFEYEGLKGHCDLFIKDIGLVVDWKTTKVKSLRYFPSDQQRWQVQLYGYLISKSGYTVNEVSLVAVARDGNMDDIRSYREPYDEATALTAIEWLNEIKAMTQPPAPEKWAGFCASYCNYYDATGEIGCTGTTK
jgi:hypothetical protein